MPAETIRPQRRTQAERRASTRQRLVTATIWSLVEHGHSATSTATIQRAAELTPGALHYHFPTKADLLAAAYLELVTTRHARMTAAAAALPESPNRVREAIALIRDDAMSPEFQATVDLIRAARTDEPLGNAIVGVQPELQPLLADTAEALLGPELARRPEVAVLMRLVRWTLAAVGIQLELLSNEQRGEALEDLFVVADCLLGSASTS